MTHPTNFHQPVHLLSASGEMRIDSATEAYAALVDRWPASRGKWYHAAARACRSASEGETSPHIARRIFMQAASEACFSAR